MEQHLDSYLIPTVVVRRHWPVMQVRAMQLDILIPNSNRSRLPLTVGDALLQKASRFILRMQAINSLSSGWEESGEVFRNFLKMHTSHTRKEPSHDHRFLRRGNPMGTSSLTPNASSVSPSPSCLSRLRPLVCRTVTVRESLSLDSKRNRRRTTSSGMVRIRLLTNRSLRKTLPATKLSSSNTQHICRTTASIFGVPLSCQGGLEMNGKQRPMVSGSNIFCGQKGQPIGT
jgi:hypothetical protein